jgi:hypothetical protein
VKNKLNGLIKNNDFLGIIDFYKVVKGSGLDKFGSLEDEIIYSYINVIKKENNLIINDTNSLYFNLKNKATFSKLCEYKLFHEVNWGKYKGLLVSEILKTDLQYFRWCVLNLDNFIICDDFFLIKKVFLSDDFLTLIEVNLMKKFILLEYLNQKSENINQEINNNQTWEDSMLNDGFEGNIDIWNHYNQ